MEHIDDYELMDKDFEKFLQIGREAFEHEASAIRSEAATERDNGDI